MRLLPWLARITCLLLGLSTLTRALEFSGLLTRPTAEEVAVKLAESRKEALRLYPDLSNPDSIFARTAKLGEDHAHRLDPYNFEDRWDYPLSIANSTSKHLRAFSPHDPVFNEVVPVFTTKNGKVYSQLKVTKMARDGISVVHEGGTAFIHRDDLTDPQRDKYRTRWSTEVLVPEQLIWEVDSAMKERDRELKLFAFVHASLNDEKLANPKSNLDREAAENHELGELPGMLYRIDNFMLRLFELAYAAQEAGQRDAMERIEHELKDPVPEPYKTRLKELEEKTGQRDVRYKEIRLLLRGKHCELRRAGRPVLKGIPKRGLLNSAEIGIVSPEHIRIRSWKNNIPSHWVFKIDLKNGESTLVPEASKDEEMGEVTFHIVK